MQKNDIVIAWVDGSDSEWARRRAKYINGNETSDALAATRFASDNEIYFCIASILKYVPFCGTIFLVTDKQVPVFINEFYEQGLCSKDKIKIIDHSEIFSGFEHAYPTFNSLTIESLIWRIKGLSRYFIYLNDDFFFNTYANREDFFVGEKIVVHGYWQSSHLIKIKVAFREFLGKIFPMQPKAKHTVSQMLGAEVIGFKKFFKVNHYPHAMDVDVFKIFFEKFPNLVERQISYKFRDIKQINPVSLLIHAKIKSNQAVIKADIPIAYLKNSNSIPRFIDAIGDEKVKYGCIQSLDQFSKADQKNIHIVMERKFKNFLPKSVVKGLDEN